MPLTLPLITHSLRSSVRKVSIRVFFPATESLTTRRTYIHSRSRTTVKANVCAESNDDAVNTGINGTIKGTILPGGAGISVDDYAEVRQK